MLTQENRAAALPHVTPQTDPWDPIHSLIKHGKHVLTSVEMTITNLCNMRCEHCAVGDMLAWNEPAKLPLEQMLRRLDEVEHLQTISITGGEPSFSQRTVTDYIIPLLRYAKSRGVRSQMNSNLTLDYRRYEQLLPYLDVMHISFNYTKPEHFHRIGFANSPHPVSLEAATKMYDRMIENTRRLSDEGMYISAESMINYRTHESIDDIHRLIVEMGCKRHEVHPMYPSAFAANLPVLSREDMLRSIRKLIDARDKSIWMLFGTLPFFACSELAEERELIAELRQQPNVTVRNDPDGRNRLNVNLFTGDVFVTDFSDVPAFGNIQQDRLTELFDRWLASSLADSVDCRCLAAGCCGPNLLVKEMYYKQTDFKQRRALL
ncbi:radical SAM/CxCxxxxC motif protein YfkAB [Paenibacillaceae bacterium]|nr:radical SAM/CxCxxxxC motif protein YfkAB [Paenibacillaceae bacterium]